MHFIGNTSTSTTPTNTIKPMYQYKKQRQNTALDSNQPIHQYTKRQRLNTAVDSNQRMVDLCEDKLKEKKRYNDAKLAILSEKNNILDRLAAAVEQLSNK